MQTYKLVGVMSGEYEGNKWGRLFLLQKLDQRGCGYFALKKEQSKCDYFLAVQIEKDWDLYENQEVRCTADLNGRIIGCELAA